MIHEAPLNASAVQHFDLLDVNVLQKASQIGYFPMQKYI